MRKKRLPQGAVIAILAAVLVMSIIGSVVLGRYPIGFRELCGIVGSRFMDIEPFWKPVQTRLCSDARIIRSFPIQSSKSHQSISLTRQYP